MWLGLLAGQDVELPATSLYPVMITAFFGTGSSLHDLTDDAAGVVMLTLILATLGGYTVWIFAAATAPSRR